MSTSMDKLQELLYGDSGFGVSNFKLFPGSNRETSQEDIAEEILKSLQEVSSVSEQSTGS